MNQEQLIDNSPPSDPAAAGPGGIIKVSIGPKYLKAMALFAGTDVTREVLSNVALDYTGAHPVLVSTDGRRLGVYSLENPDSFCDVSQAKGKVLLIPTALIAQIKGSTKQIGQTRATFEFEGSTVRMNLDLFGRLTSMAQGVSDGRFPAWRQVLPNDPVKAFPTLCLNAQYVADFQKAGEILNGSSTKSSVSASISFPTFVAHGAESDKYPVSPYSVSLAGVTSFYGVVMSVRLSAQDEERRAEYSKPPFLN